MLGEAGKLGIRARSSQYLGVASSHCTTALALERTGDDCCPAALGTGADEFIHEVDQLVREANSDLLAHPMMVPVW